MGIAKEGQCCQVRAEAAVYPVASFKNVLGGVFYLTKAIKCDMYNIGDQKYA